MPTTVLIVTCVDDVHADAFIARAEQLHPEWHVVRVHTADMATNWSFRFQFESSGDVNATLLVRDSGRQLSKPDVIWWRKPDTPQPHPALSDPSAIDCSRQEYRELMHSLAGCFPDAVWVNDYWRMAQNASKLNQIALARSHGLLIPETIIATSADAVRAFAARFRQVIAKPLYFSGFVHSGQQYACWTNVLTDTDLTSLTDADLALAPLIIQRRLRKALELRVTVIGEEVFPCAISTSHDTVEGIDWRVKDVEQLPHRLVNIPDRVSMALRGILRDMRLNFGAFDLVLDEDGAYYLLELNPNGQFYWVELLTGAPLIDAMLRLTSRLAGST